MAKKAARQQVFDGEDFPKVSETVSKAVALYTQRMRAVPKATTKRDEARTALIDAMKDEGVTLVPLDDGSGKYFELTSQDKLITKARKKHPGDDDE